MAKQTVIYQETMQALENIVERLQADDIELDEAMQLHEKGQALAAQLEEYLKTAENSIKKRLGE